MTSDTEMNSGEITLLGLIAAVAEAWKWFLIVPIATAVAVYLVIGQFAADYRSSAILRADDTVALLTSPSVLRATIEQLDMHGELGSTMDNAIRDLRRRVSTTIVAPGITQVSVTGRSAEQAQEILTAIIRNFALQVAPRGQQREEIERQIAASNTAIEQLRRYAASLTSDRRNSNVENGGSNDAALGYVALVNEIQMKENHVVRLERSLEGLTQANILQQPTLADDAEPSSRLALTLFAAVAAALAVLFVVLIGEVMRRVPHDPLASADLQRIRDALHLSRQPSK